MPQKGKMNKSRTAKSKGKVLKLRWWYVLPVIAIVAIAGYVIVRYGKATMELDPRGPQFFTGGVSTQNKNNIPIRVVGGSPVRIKYGNGDKDRTAVPISIQRTPYGYGLGGKWVCVEAWVGNYNNNPAAWSVNMKANVPFPYPFDDRYQTVAESNKIFYSKNSWDRQCIKIKDQANIYQIDITITNGFPGNTSNQPFVGVSKVWWQSSL